MKPLDHFPERFPPTGTMAAEGVLNQLGRPRMGPLEVLVREAVQNCWDAKAPESDQVRVGFSLIELGEAQRKVLTDVVFRSLPPEEAAGRIPSTKQLLVISDRGTSGLGGVLRANQAGEDPRDFVDFIRNVGQPPDTARGGGTYGYGKVALYLASKVRTILVDTRCRYEGRLQRRLVAARLGEQYVMDGERFTGRHWWGRTAPDGVLDPATDAEATSLAQALGLPDFGPEERGSNIALLAPDFGDMDDVDTMSFIAEAIAWNFWPKMIAVASTSAPIDFRVESKGSVVPLPDIGVHPVLSAFSQAFLQLKQAIRDEAHHEEEGKGTFDVRCEKPKQHLGILSLVRFPHLAPVASGTDHADENEGAPTMPGLRGRIHHTALLRFPELVVKYQEGPESASPGVDYAGVFLADPEMDRVFAASEPPTHDDWVADGLENRWHRTFARVAGRRISEAMKSFSGVTSVPPASAQEGSSLGFLAGRLSGLLPGISGPGAQEGGPSGRPNTGRGNGAPRDRKPVVHIEGEPVLEVLEGGPVVTVRTKVSIPEGTEAVAVRATAHVLLETGRPESEPPAGAAIPRILQWRDDAGMILGTDDRIIVHGSGEHRIEVSASAPVDTSVVVDVTCRTTGGDHG